MITRRDTLIAREGWPVIAGLTAAALLAGLLGGVLLAVPAWVAVATSFYLFRDPRRHVPALPLAVVSPVDGVVTAVEPADDPCLERKAIRIAICMSVAGAYSVRSPVEGRVMRRWQTRLLDRSCSNPHGNDVHDDYGIWMQTDEADDVVVLIAGGRPLRHPRFYVETGDRAGQGQRCGFIRFGTRIDVLVPETSRLEVAAGQRVHSGESVVATLVHKSVREADNGATNADGEPLRA